MTALLALSALAAALVGSGPASAATDTGSGTEVAAPAARPTAVVALGDSYISGEGGRWEGNHARDYGDRRGTDRAAYRGGWFWRYSPNRIYGPTNASGCHRSDVSPVATSGIAVDALVNLACSGASTVNLVRSSAGGVGLKGEPSQADQLADLAATHDVELVVVSVGGNDLGFGTIILDCALDYALSSSWWSQTCNADQQRNVDARLPEAMAGVGQAIDEIRAVLADAGQGPDSYRLALLSYPSPVPSGDEFRYRQGSWSRTFTGGCPFWNVDATWARDSFVPMLADSLAAVAADRGVEFLDLQDALEGREICADGARQGDGADAEWARYLSTGVLQGEAQESLHPNAIGQQAIGRCLGLLASATPGDYRCTNTPGAGPEAMELSGR
ncbi:MAG: GDSL-type esterase/lipase family protein [Actinomycetota bacterium]